jgi:hypothetical protein
LLCDNLVDGRDAAAGAAMPQPHVKLIETMEAVLERDARR